MTKVLFLHPTTLAADAPEAGNGTIWSHAVTPGEYVYNGKAFTIDAKKINEFVANFNGGYPAKVPVDYDHGTTSGVANGSQPVPKAGDVVEMHAVNTTADITPDIQAAIDKAQAELDAIGSKTKLNPLGLWVRWHPTGRALGMVKAREYTEMSIAFNESQTDNKGGEQGATIVAVAITNTPFVDDMVSIAASGGRGGNGAVPPTERKGMSKLLALVAAITGKAVTTDDEATTELTALRAANEAAATQVVELSDFRRTVSAELGGDDKMTVPQALAKIREFAAKAAAAGTTAAADKDRALDAQVALGLKPHENKLTVPSKEYFGRQLRAELAAGVALGATETEKALATLSPIVGADTQQAGGDPGKGIDNVALAHAALAKAQADPRVVELAKTDRNAAMLLAVSIASREVPDTGTEVVTTV